MSHQLLVLWLLVKHPIFWMGYWTALFIQTAADGKTGASLVCGAFTVYNLYRALQTVEGPSQVKESK